jgi:hypothetical protein
MQRGSRDVLHEEMGRKRWRRDVTVLAVMLWGPFTEKCRKGHKCENARMKDSGVELNLRCLTTKHRLTCARGP